MDLEEWEVVLSDSDDGFVDMIQDDGGRIQEIIFPRKYYGDPEIVWNMNYFVCCCKSPISKEIIILDPKRAENQLILPVGGVPLPPPMELEKVKKLTTDDDDDDSFPVPVETTEDQVVKSPPPGGGGVNVWETDYIVSQVSFKKMKDQTEFVDMKMDSPRAGGGWPGIVPPQIDQAAAGLFQFEGDDDTDDDDEREVEIEEEEEERGESQLDSSKGIRNKWERENRSSGVPNNIFKWSLSGIGAICSFGVAAATICIIVLGNGNQQQQQQRNKQQQNHKIQFQIFTHDNKRFNQVVNEAMSAARGVPLTTAHFTYGGGHYDHGPPSDN